jgi:cytochrome c
MNAYRLNQVAMAVLGALLLFFGTRTLIHIATEEPEAEKPGMETPGGKPGEKPGEAAKVEPGADVLPLLAKADPAKGAEVAKKCQVCHSFDKGGPAIIGPDLYGVLGRDVASVPGFDYSPQLKAKSGKWDYQSVAAMDENPAAYVPGTKMALFPGLPSAEERAGLLAFMRTKSDSPPPLPEMKVAPGPTAPAGQAAKPEGKGEGTLGADAVALLGKADPQKGAEVAKKCEICHSFDKGGPTIVGPNLYGVLGRRVASVEGFDYSSPLKAKDGNWDYQSVSAMDANPAAYVPGTKMAIFAGLPDAQQRANLLAFMRTKSDSPPPLPAADGGGAPAGGAPAKNGAETPAPAGGGEQPAPSSETPPAQPAPSAEKPPAQPSAETPPAPSAETPPAQSEAPKIESAPAREPPAKAQLSEGHPPSAEAPPSSETPPAAPEDTTEALPAPEASPPSEAISGEAATGQPEPEYPNGPPQ